MYREKRAAPRHIRGKTAPLGKAGLFRPCGLHCCRHCLLNLCGLFPCFLGYASFAPPVGKPCGRYRAAVCDGFQELRHIFRQFRLLFWRQFNISALGHWLYSFDLPGIAGVGAGLASPGLFCLTAFAAGQTLYSFLFFCDTLLYFFFL